MKEGTLTIWVAFLPIAKTSNARILFGVFSSQGTLQRFTKPRVPLVSYSKAQMVIPMFLTFHGHSQP
jgi:hypothetical protein